MRQATQTLTLALFVYLVVAGGRGRATVVPVDLFFRLDPLAALAAMLAGRAWLSGLALAFVTLALTVAVGRAWCGWLCPLGTILDWTALPGARRRAAAIPERWRSARHLMLALVLAGAALGSLALLGLDPLALLTRAAAASLLPALNHAVTAGEAALYRVPALRPAVDGLERLLRGAVLPTQQAAFAQNAALAALLAGIVALNALAGRVWCRYLCPLGALLGLVSKAGLVRPAVSQACSRCARCTAACPVGAIEAEPGYAIAASECTLCLDCLAACPKGAIGLRLGQRPEAAHKYDPTRRQVLGALVAGAAGVALARTGVRSRAAHAHLIRPPGADREGAFLSRCLRCGQCLNVCPTSGLQPALFEAGLEGLWTPRLVPRLGYCDYGCNACGRACPSGAIPALPLDGKRQQVLGLAAVNRNRCLPWAYGVPCIVCEEMCPLPEKAIRLEEMTVTGAGGQPVTVQCPSVREDLCIGCGICEYRCPQEGEAAIRVYRRQRSRL